MDDKQIINRSKRLAKALRHDPAGVGLTLDAAGWVAVADVLRALRLDRAALDEIVANNNKKRFEYNDDGSRIRATQGHSVSVELGLAPVPPPPVLYHGTVATALPAIRTEGLRPMSRHHVHLSATEQTARAVGMRRGKPVILTVAAGPMAAAGHEFFVTSNGVWLTAEVPPRYLAAPGEH